MKRLDISLEDMMSVLDTCYNKAINGLPKSKNCNELAKEYLSKYDDLQIAAKKFINHQIAKCSTSGFITSLGGLITLPVSVPANVGSVLYVQIRMIATLASMNNYDPTNDEIQTLAYICLVNTSITEICRDIGVQIANKISMNTLKKIPGKFLTKINQKVGFRLLTKFGEKGVINLVKVVPITGGITGAGIDFAETKAISDRAYKVFILNDIK